MSVYMDDLAVHMKKRDNKAKAQHYHCHWKHVHHILDKLAHYNLYLKPEKCAFKQDEIDYLGVIVGKDALKMDPQKVKGVTNWPKLNTPTNVCSFLGFTSYYRYFVPNYSKIA
jgi:reverse transcriptase-like protein